MPNQHINPDYLFRLDGFSQVVVSTAPRLAFIAGQGALDSTFNIIGKGDYFEQTCTVLRTIARIVADFDAPAQLVSSTIYVVGLDPAAIEQISRALGCALDGAAFPAHAYNLIGVAALGHPDMLVEIGAVVALG